MNCLDKSIIAGLTRQLAKGAPEYGSTEQINRHQETEIFKHYWLIGYWTRALKANLVRSQ